MGKHSKPGCLASVAAGAAIIVALACAGGSGTSEPEPRAGGPCRLDGEQVSVPTDRGASHHTLVCRDGHWEPL